MTFVLTSWKRGPNGAEPLLPIDDDDVDGCAVLFSNAERLIANVSTEQEPWKALSDIEVSRELDILLWSAEDYIPAMARARWRISKDDEAATDDDFIRRVHEVLNTELASQPTDKAVLVQSLICESMYREIGGYVWALSISKDGLTLTWAASDAEIYSDPVDTFDISPELKQRLMAPSLPRDER